MHVLRIPPGTAKPTVYDTFASGLLLPFVIAFYPAGPDPEWVYVAVSDGLIWFPYRNGNTRACGAAQLLVQRIPIFHHWARDIVFNADGSRIFFSVLSGSNAALDMFPDPMAFYNSSNFPPKYT